MITSIDLDHVAIALERQADAWPRYVGDLGGRWIAGGPSVGFDSAQVRYANGMKLEALEPAQVERNDFLRRFLDANGPGVHHLTFKVADIHAALAEVEGAGIRPVGVDLSDPGWKEAFLHPKEASGVVVQLAQSTGSWSSPAPDDLPAPPPSGTATLSHVTHAVASLDDGLHFFADLLGGERSGDGAGPDGRWVDLAWPGPGRIRVLEPVAEGRTWLGGRSGRVHHLAFAVDDPGDVADARPIGEGAWEVDADENHGVRLRLSSRR